MRLVTNRWYAPCGCILDFQFDIDLDENTRTHTITNSVFHCPAHSYLPNQKNLSQDTDVSPITENVRRPGRILKVILDTFPTLGQTVDGVVVLKDGITINYIWVKNQDNSATLNISATGITLTATQKTNLQTKADQMLGAGRILFL